MASWVSPGSMPPADLGRRRQDGCGLGTANSWRCSNGTDCGPDRHRREERFEQSPGTAVRRDRRVTFRPPDRRDDHLTAKDAAGQERLDVVRERNKQAGMAITSFDAERHGPIVHAGARRGRLRAVSLDPCLDVGFRSDRDGPHAHADVSVGCNEGIVGRADRVGDIGLRGTSRVHSDARSSRADTRG